VGKTNVFCPRCGQEWDWTISHDPHEYGAISICDKCYEAAREHPPEDLRPCTDCGKEFENRSLWICPDDKLRCGDCLIEREDKAYGIPRGERG